MNELNPETGILWSVSEAQIMSDFGKYEGITITRLDNKTVKAAFQEAFGEGSVTGDSVLNVLLHAVRRQKTEHYWQGYRAAEEKDRQNLGEEIARLQEQQEELTDSITQLKETMDTAIRLLGEATDEQIKQIEGESEE